MYEERQNNFSIKGALLQVLIVVVLVFTLLWLFPTKSYIKDYVDDTFINKLQPLYNQIYAQNLNSMKEAAISYFTVDRLPSKVGDSVTMTLGEMQSKKLVLDLKDSNNNSCSTTDSYVKLTKKDKEYVLTVNLSCSDITDYIDVYIGCYNYCPTGVCEKQEEKKVVTVSKPSKPVTPAVPSVVKYQYEYEKITNGKWGEWSDWSKWSLNEYTETDYRRIETKQSTVQTGSTLAYKKAQVKTSCANGEYDSKTGKCKITTKSSKTLTQTPTCKTGKYDSTTGLCLITNVISSSSKDACPAGYTLTGTKCIKTITATPVCDTANGYKLSGTTCVKEGTTTIKEVKPTCDDGYDLNGIACVKRAASTTTYVDATCSKGTLSGSKCVYTYTTGEYTDWVYAYTQTYNSKKTSTDTVKYALIGSSVNTNCGTGCTTNTYTYKVYTRSAKTAQGSVEPTCKEGTFDSSKGKCKVVKTGELIIKDAVCEHGILDKTKGKCIITSKTVSTAKTPTCPNGYNLNGGACVKYDTKDNNCDAIYKLNGTKCVKNAITVKNYQPPVCTNGYKLDGKVCKKDVKVTTTTYENAKVTYSCDASDGSTLRGTQCVKSLPVYTTFTYYRYQTRKFISGNRDVKWSLSKNDKTLLDKGYVLTGNKKEVK